MVVLVYCGVVLAVSLIVLDFFRHSSVLNQGACLASKTRSLVVVSGGSQSDHLRFISLCDAMALRFISNSKPGGDS